MSSYHEEKKIKDVLRLRELTKELPEFLEDFFREISNSKKPSTILSYAFDIKIFLNYLIINCDEFKNSTLKDFDFELFKTINSKTIHRYMEYLNYYSMDVNGVKKDFTNNPEGKQTKLAAIRTLFTYFYKNEMIEKDPSKLVDYPKLNKKNIIHLEIDEVARLLDEIESGENLTDRQKKFHEKSKERDLAIVTLILGTGMRISECIGTDITDIDFNNNSVKIIRKGGDEALLYFGQEVRNALLDYLEIRNKIELTDSKENALFLSSRKKRMNVKTVQNLVKKYAFLINTVKNITPHKLRATFATTLYEETDDIYLVAEVLGHADINTTKKHYAKMSEERKRRAANIVKLREN